MRQEQSDDDQPSQAQRVAQISARLEVVPCLKLLTLRFPVNAYYTSIRHGDSPELPRPSPSWLAGTRRESH